MSDLSSHSEAAPAHNKLNYGWIIVAVCGLSLALNYGLMYSYSVFFKPIAEYFNWDRATVSSVYSVSLVLRGAASIAIGWLADKYGAIKVTIFCGFMMGWDMFFPARSPNSGSFT